MVENLVKELREIDRVAVPEKEIKRAGSEAIFIKISVDILIEVGALVCTAGHILPSTTKGWTRDQAIVGGRVNKVVQVNRLHTRSNM